MMNNQDIKICRICLDEDDQKDLISPCNCAGSTKYVHRDCLENWRATNINEDNYKRCEICLSLIFENRNIQIEIFDLLIFSLSL